MGAFLALYFATVGVVISASYRQVPRRLREVAVGEPVGVAYLRLIAFTGASALFMAGLAVAGFQPGRLSLCAIALLSVAGVLSFLQLGLRLFSFLSVGTIGDGLLGRLLQAARDATPSGYRWDDASFQQNTHAQANAALGQLDELVGVLGADPIERPELPGLAAKVVWTLETYLAVKARIPPRSRWFLQVAEPQSLLSPGSFALEEVERTGVPPAPKLVPDHLWVERRSLALANKVTSITLHDLPVRSEMLGLVAALQGLAEKLTPAFDIEVLALVEDGLWSVIEGLRASLGASKKKDASVQDFACVEAVFLVPGALVAALGRALREKGTSPRVAAIVDSMLSRASQVGCATSASTRSGIAELREELAFERSVEGEVTPRWFVEHHAARLCAADVVAAYAALMKMSRRWYVGGIGGLLGAGAFDLASLALQRGFEAAVKLEYHATAVNQALNQLRRFQRPFGGTNWPRWDLDQAMDEISALRKDLLRAALVASKGVSEELTDGIPDLFGYLFTILAEKLFAAVMTKDDDTFAEIFPVFLGMAVRAQKRAYDDLSGAKEDVRLRAAIDVFIDAIEISGYAYLMSAITGSSAWAAVNTAWSAFLQALPKTQDWAVSVMATLRFHERTPTISARDLRRTRWSQACDEWLRHAGFLGNDFLSYDPPRVTPVDRLAAAFVGESRIGLHARDLFLVAFLRGWCGQQAVETPSGVQRLDEMMGRGGDS